MILVFQLSFNAKNKKIKLRNGSNQNFEALKHLISCSLN